ncbi:MAG: ParB/RepB/Spo0J family partition protein [Clostridia bacterium]|nr:ParB/RepB/Spo0J family partition protein [Clostridia bacterium]
MAKNKGLGKGLEALFADSDYALATDSQIESSFVSMVRLSDIEPDKEQPRKNFNEEALKTLSESIERHGVLQPLVVRKVETNSSESVGKLLGEKYTIISGERRWRAAKMAGLTQVPVVVKQLSDTEVAAVMLVENLQREDLNPVELAQGLKRLIDEFGLTQEEAAAIVGISRPAITNSLRLLTLPDEVLDTLSSGDITSGHARALLPLGDADTILSKLQIIVAKNLSVRETEKLVKDYLNEKEREQKQLPDDKTLKNIRDMKVYISKLEEKLSSGVGRKISISQNKKKPESGKLEIEYYNEEDFEALVKLLCGNDILNEN